MSASVVPVLRASEDQNLSLEGVEVEGRLTGALAEVLLTQTYRNLESSSIEVVYTFPLPLDAVLLELVMEIGERRLTGVVQKKAEAEGRYEEAIEEGDTAVLLEKAGPGLYAVNVGNLQPGERAVIKFRYSQLLHWQGDSLRFQMPTTLAPRYGDPSGAGLEPHQEPEHTLQANHGFRLSVTIDGSLASAPLECPTHPISVSEGENGRTVSLSGGRAHMDRDFVLVIREPEGGHSEALVAPADGGVVVMATFHPQLAVSEQITSRAIKLVVDCSGSMAGDSIAQAKSALSQIVDRLLPTDHFNIIAFGSCSRTLFSETVPVGEETLAAARQFVNQMDADMGGTKMADALEAAYQSVFSPNLAANILLITDGEVWDDGGLLSAARASEHRIFTIGVGSAVAEETVRSLADATGGACELVTPREDMAERIVRHFKRINQPAASGMEVDWGSQATRQAPERVRSLYEGDTVHVFGWLPETPTGSIQLRATTADGNDYAQTVELRTLAPKSHSALCLSRIAGWRLLSQVEPEEACQIALEHQLVTEYTSCVLVDVRDDDEKATKLPNLRKIQHAVPAGWGGTGAVAFMSRAPGIFACTASECSDYGLLTQMDRAEPPKKLMLEALASKLSRVLSGRISRRDFAFRIQTLVTLGLPQHLAVALLSIVDEGFSEHQVTLAFIQKLFDDHIDYVDPKAQSSISVATGPDIPKDLKDKIHDLRVE